MSDKKLINDLNKVQTKLYNKMYCWKLSDFKICVRDINKNQQFEASAKPELDPHTNDSKEIHANKMTEQSYKLNDICLFDLPWSKHRDSTQRHNNSTMYSLKENSSPQKVRISNDQK